MLLRLLFNAHRLSPIALVAAVALGSGCGLGQGDITFDDALYSDALEFVDMNSGEVCEPDMDTFIPGNADHGGDTSMGVPTTNPDEDRHGGDDNQFGGNGSGDSLGEHTGDGADGTANDDGEVTGNGAGADGAGGTEAGYVDEEAPLHDNGSGCDANGCCTGNGDLDRERDRVRCRCRLRIRGADEFVLPACCEYEEEPPLETDDDMPPPAADGDEPVEEDPV